MLWALAKATIRSARSNENDPCTLCNETGFISFSAVKQSNCSAIRDASLGLAALRELTAAPINIRVPAACRSVTAGVAITAEGGFCCPKTVEVNARQMI